MIKQYPYELWAQTLSEGSVQTDQGDFVASVPNWELVSVCRDEVNGGGRTVLLEDATAYVYDSLIQLPKTCPVLANGTPVRVMQDETIRVSGAVRRFQTDQLHSRLWL
jgi:hypothetical protein